MSKKLNTPNTKTISNAATTEAQAGAAHGTFAKAAIPYQTESKVGMNVILNGTLLADSHTAAFIQWKKNKQA